MHPLPCRNPHCSSSIAHSVPALTLLISTLKNSLPTTLNKLIPLELLHSHLSPFILHRGTIQAPRQSIGTTPISKLKFYSLTSNSNTAIPPFFKHSTGNQSSPGALPDFISFIASPTSSNDIALSFKSPNTGIRQISPTPALSQVPFSMAIGNGELMHECFPKNLRMGTARMKYREREKEMCEHRKK